MDQRVLHTPFLEHAQELPFFGTSSSWSNVMGGVVVSGNPREGAIENWPVSEAVLRQSVESELGYPVLLHLLRTEEKEGELSRPYELLVRDADETPGVLDMMMPLISFAIVWWCSTQLDSNSSLQQLGAVIQPGSSPPWVMVLVLLLVGELARTVVASQNGTSVGPRTGSLVGPPVHHFDAAETALQDFPPLPTVWPHRGVCTSDNRQSQSLRRNEAEIVIEPS